jgi:hypothetical protein
MDKSGERTAHPFRQFKSGFRPPLPSPVSRFPFPVSRFPSGMTNWMWRCATPPLSFVLLYR